MMPGETILSGADAKCKDCGVDTKAAVLRSPAGHYIGTMCDCGPYSRETGYFPSKDEADAALVVFQEGGPLARKRE